MSHRIFALSSSSKYRLLLIVILALFVYVSQISVQGRSPREITPDHDELTRSAIPDDTDGVQTLDVSNAVLSFTQQAAICPGDFDDNGMVNIADFLLFTDVFGTSSSDDNYNALMDMDGNGEIGIADFLLFTSVFGTTCEAPPQISDRAVLVILYNATDGPNWRNNTNWLTDAPLDDWYGVDTDASGRIVRLDLSGRWNIDTRTEEQFGLWGPIPAELGNLTNLRTLDLGNNALSGPIPPELGHNLSLNHAPCGFPPGIDVAYPYQDGMIGAWGYDFSSERLIGPMYVDLMTYCNPAWISDYQFDKALRFRLSDEDASEATVTPTLTTSLLLWGGKDAEENPYLEPAFVVNAPPSLPQSGSQYRIIGRNATHTELFSLTFDMPEVACGDGSSSFAFVLPVDPEWKDKLASITLTCPGGFFTMDGNTDRPMVILRNPQSGQVRGFLRDIPGKAMVASKIAADALSSEPGLEALFSRGIPGAEAYQR